MIAPEGHRIALSAVAWSRLRRKESIVQMGEIMLLVRWCWPFFVFALTVPGCGTHGSAGDPQLQAAIAGQQDEIVNRLIPEDGLTFTRRARLIDATIFVLGKGDREELQNVSNLRNTLSAASLQNLKDIEANYKERLADAE
jgi:hypothetical protein